MTTVKNLYKEFEVLLDGEKLNFKFFPTNEVPENLKNFVGSKIVTHETLVGRAIRDAEVGGLTGFQAPGGYKK